jgi:hypothetical protein
MILYDFTSLIFQRLIKKDIKNGTTNLNNIVVPTKTEYKVKGIKSFSNNNLIITILVLNLTDNAIPKMIDL